MAYGNLVIVDGSSKTLTLAEQRLLEQYRELLKERPLAATGTNIANEDVVFGWGEKGNASFYLLLDDDCKVIAGATITTRLNHGIHENWEFLEKKQPLPLPTYDFFEYTFGHMSDVVSKPLGHKIMPGLELQRQLLEALKNGKLAANVDGKTQKIDILKGYVPQNNVLTLYEAAKDSGLKSVVRQDLVRNNEGVLSFFIAATANPAIDLIPEGFEKDVMPEENLHKLAHDELTRYKKANPKPRSNIQKSEVGGINPTGPNLGF